MSPPESQTPVLFICTGVWLSGGHLLTLCQAALHQLVSYILYTSL
jgi:hypothetical protein